ncbi:MAG: hypothetical protein ACPGJV_12800 [Bacteriovoracaceae bacterium]
MNKKKDYFQRRRKNRIKRILAPIRIFGTKKRIGKENDGLAYRVREQSKSLGLSTNDFVELFLKQDIYRGYIKEVDFPPCIKDRKFIAKRFRHLEFSKELKFDIDLKLPYFNEQDDPVYNALDKLCSLKKIAKQKFLMEVYYRFLRINGYQVDGRGDLLDVNDDESYLNLVTSMHFRNNWKPYNWTFPLSLTWDYHWQYLDKNGNNSRSKEKKVTIKIPKSNTIYSSNAIDLTIVHLGFIFQRSYSYLFKMLVLMMFREIGVVDEFTFELKSNYQDLLSDLNLKEIKHFNV